MDAYLIDYLRSGKAWVIVGSGPSIEMGYPSWRELAARAVAAVRSERSSESAAPLERLVAKRNYPAAFQAAEKILGLGHLRELLKERLIPQRPGRIYDLITKWPVPVYLTTNYDNELMAHLSAIGQAYLEYTNSADHLAYLLPEASGTVCKLHGDLRSDTGLVLTASHYREILQGPAWEYWRTKLTSIFQMNRVVIIGHSLEDRHVRHVLEAAKVGSGVLQPVCWIAPDVPLDVAAEYLEKWRIRVISYDNRDGEHQQLLKLIENLSDFIPSRTSVRIKAQIAAVSQSPLGRQAGAPGFFVFNKLAVTDNFDETRAEVLLAAIQSVHSRFTGVSFQLSAALEVAGWPADVRLAHELRDQVLRSALERRVLVEDGNGYRFAPEATDELSQRQRAFEHARDSFKLAIKLRLRRNFPALGDDDAGRIAEDVDAALTGFFRECGLTLASTLFRGHRAHESAVPASIAAFINEASARYDDLLFRQAFSSACIDIFVRGEAAERDYIGRVSQGFFGFHAVGVLGDAAAERLRHARDTVWLIDSSAQIPAIALGAEANSVFADCFTRLHDIGVRLFTTNKLFDETAEHLWFANSVIQKYGPESPHVIAAATGQAPYRKSNVFLQGFIRWQAAGNPSDWQSYLYQLGGIRSAGPENVAAALAPLGFEVVPFANWPGYEGSDLGTAIDTAHVIASRTAGQRQQRGEISDAAEFLRKAQPEAEALLVVRHERTGKYHILSDAGIASPAFFISNTSILNLLEPERVTWQPEAFVRFGSTLAGGTTPEAAERAFQALVWSIAESGLTIIDERIVESVFGGVIDEAAVVLDEQRAAYNEVLAAKYGESIESVMSRVARAGQPMAAIQIANEIAEQQTKRRQEIESTLATTQKELANTVKRARDAEHGLAGVSRYTKKLAERRRNAQKNQRRAASKKRKR